MTGAALTTINLADLKAAPATRSLTVDAALLPAVAERLQLPELTALSAEIRIRLTAGRKIEVAGTLHARLKQTCVVSLEPFDTTLEAPFLQIFTTDPAVAAAEVEDPLDDSAWPELLEEDSLDLVEFVIQQLALSLDPYPRAPGVEFEAVVEAASDSSSDPTSQRPFEGLDALLKRDK
jgi:uncharacterized metal-binding protein YceD (DUF177 family)